MINRYKDESVNIILQCEDGLIPDGYHAKMTISKKDFTFEKELDVNNERDCFILNLGTGTMKTLEGAYKLVIIMYNNEIDFGQRLLDTILDIKG